MTRSRNNVNFARFTKEYLIIVHVCVCAPDDGSAMAHVCVCELLLVPAMTLKCTSSCLFNGVIPTVLSAVDMCCGLHTCE